MGGTDALRRSLGLTGYKRKGLGSSAAKALQQADKNLPSNRDDIELENPPPWPTAHVKGQNKLRRRLMISQSTPCGSPRPEEGWLGSKRQ